MKLLKTVPESFRNGEANHYFNLPEFNKLSENLFRFQEIRI